MGSVARALLLLQHSSYPRTRVSSQFIVLLFSRWHGNVEPSPDVSPLDRGRHSERLARDLVRPEALAFLVLEAGAGRRESNAYTLVTTSVFQSRSCRIVVLQPILAIAEAIAVCCELHPQQTRQRVAANYDLELQIIITDDYLGCQYSCYF
jgi:hypothetical protein